MIFLFYFLDRTSADDDNDLDNNDVDKEDGFRLWQWASGQIFNIDIFYINININMYQYFFQIVAVG